LSSFRTTRTLIAARTRFDYAEERRSEFVCRAHRPCTFNGTRSRAIAETVAEQRTGAPRLRRRYDIQLGCYRCEGASQSGWWMGDLVASVHNLQMRRPTPWGRRAAGSDGLVGGQTLRATGRGLPGRDETVRRPASLSIPRLRRVVAMYRPFKLPDDPGLIYRGIPLLYGGIYLYLSSGELSGARIRGGAVFLVP